jgi:hypothetical protein
MFVIAVLLLITAAYYFGRNGATPKYISPAATESPTTAVISRTTSSNTGKSGFTIRLDDTADAGAILNDLRSLARTSSNTCQNKSNLIDDYTFQFTNPSIIYTAQYGNCYLVSDKGNNFSFSANPKSATGSKLWSDVANVTGQNP